MNIDEFDPHPQAESNRISRKSIVDQQAHYYIWHGTNLAEILVERLADMDAVLVENLGIGIDPTVTNDFYLYTQYCYTKGEKKLFIYRFLDFVQQRPVNFTKVKKFHHPRFGLVRNWHSVLYPTYPNIRYIAINRYER